MLLLFKAKEVCSVIIIAVVTTVIVWGGCSTKAGQELTAPNQVADNEDKGSTYRTSDKEIPVSNKTFSFQIEVVRKFVADHGYKIFTNSEANTTIKLPSSFSDIDNDFPIGERIRRMNELSKQNGYDFSGYLGRTVSLFTCSTEENNNEGVHLNMIMDGNKMVGFWCDDHTNPPDFNLLVRTLTE